MDDTVKDSLIEASQVVGNVAGLNGRAGRSGHAVETLVRRNATLMAGSIAPYQPFHDALAFRRSVSKIIVPSEERSDSLGGGQREGAGPTCRRESVLQVNVVTTRGVAQSIRPPAKPAMSLRVHPSPQILEAIASLRDGSDM